MTYYLTPPVYHMLDSSFQIDYDINLDTKYHVPNKPLSVEIIY